MGVGLDTNLDDSTTKAKIAFVVQEWCNKGSLRNTVIQQMTQGPKHYYSNADALRWMISIAKALKYLHGSNPM